MPVNGWTTLGRTIISRNCSSNFLLTGYIRAACGCEIRDNEESMSRMQGVNGELRQAGGSTFKGIRSHRFGIVLWKSQQVHNELASKEGLTETL